MKTKKLLSLLLALMMMLSVVPFYASAAEPIALTEANVTVWPTASGSIYFGQKISDGITLSGGEVQYDGAVVAGHFEFIDPELRPAHSSTQIADIKFIPDDTTAYSGFEIVHCFDVLYTMNKTTPVFVDANDTIPVATEVVPGAKLSTSTLSGAKVKNPYYEDEPKALAGVWKWAKGTTVVNESGYYEARITISGYERLTAQVYVKVKGNTVNTTIAEAPTVGELTYDANRTWADVTLTGGKAVEEGTETEVAGTFAFTNTAINSLVPSAGTRELEITFTPDDTDKYLSSTTTITVTVNPAKIAFVDENGAEIVPEVTVLYGQKMGTDLTGYLRPYLNATASFNYEETEFYNTVVPVGTHELTVKTICDNTNYERYNTLTFKLTVEPVEADVEIRADVNAENKNARDIYVIRANADSVRPQGTFAIYVDGVLVADGLKHADKATWTPAESKAYELKAVYTPVDNDPCIVADIVSTVDVNLYRTVTTVNTISDVSKEYRCGETVEVTSNVLEFSGWKITDANGNEVDLGVDTTGVKLTLTVPDYDITVEAIDKSEASTDGGLDNDNIFGDIDLGDLTEGDSDNAIVNVFNNIIAWIKNIINTIIELFRSIGNNT